MILFILDMIHSISCYMFVIVPSMFAVLPMPFQHVVICTNLKLFPMPLKHYSFFGYNSAVYSGFQLTWNVQS